MPKLGAVVAEMPGGSSPVSPAILEKRGTYDSIVQSLPQDFTVQVLEPDGEETTREIMVSLAKAAVRTGIEVVTRNDGKLVYVRMAKPDEAEAKRRQRAKLQSQNQTAKASSNGKNKPE